VPSLRPVLADVTIHMWTDSQITLYWIYDLKQSTQSKPFIANWVSEIKETFPSTVWTYVPTSENPADLLTRGISTQQLKDSQLCLHGPLWLTSPDQWPTWSPTSVLHIQNVEVEDTPVTSEPTNTDSWCSSDH